MSHLRGQLFTIPSSHAFTQEEYEYFAMRTATYMYALLYPDHLYPVPQLWIEEYRALTQMWEAQSVHALSKKREKEGDAA